MLNIVDCLNKALSSYIALSIKTLGFHWNVRGANFSQLHQMFEDQYKDLSASIDMLAEHIRTFNVLVQSGLSQFTMHSAINDSIITEETKWQDMVGELSMDYKKMIALCTEIHHASENDLVTQDLATNMIKSHTKTIWMLDSLLK